MAPTIIPSRRFAGNGEISVTPTANGARMEITDANTGMTAGGFLDNEQLLAFGKKCIETANRSSPNKLIIPGGP
jgi:hypothetical protein